MKQASGLKQATFIETPLAQIIATPYRTVVIGYARGRGDASSLRLTFREFSKRRNMASRMKIACALSAATMDAA